MGHELMDQERGKNRPRAVSVLGNDSSWSNSTRSDQPFQKLIYPIRYSQLSITFAVFDMFVCISFTCLRVHVELIQPLAARNNKRCFFISRDREFILQS